MDWTFEGSNDGNTWTILHTKKGQPLVEGEKKMKFSLPTAPACTGKPLGLSVVGLWYFALETLSPKPQRHLKEQFQHVVSRVCRYGDTVCVRG